MRKASSSPATVGRCDLDTMTKFCRVRSGSQLDAVAGHDSSLSLPDDPRYDGLWRKDSKGISAELLGGRYEGEMRDSLAQGHGVYTQTDGSKYSGQWEAGKMHGNGAEEWFDNVAYVGQYMYGNKHGEGQFTWADGSCYIGQFKAGEMCGQGFFRWADGREYRGQWLKNNMHGRGHFKWTDGQEYEGGYMNDQRHGHGVFTWPDGRRYDGKWKYGKRHGSGHCTDLVDDICAYTGLRYRSRGQSLAGEWGDDRWIRWVPDGSAKSSQRPASDPGKPSDPDVCQEDSAAFRLLRSLPSRNLRVRFPNDTGSYDLSQKQTVDRPSYLLVSIVGGLGLLFALMWKRKML